MIHIMQIDTMDDIAYDHVKCPQCHSRLCGKMKGERVHLLHFERVAKVRHKPLFIACPRCKSNYLISNADE